MSTTQIRGLLKDGSFLTKSVDDVVAELVKGKKVFKEINIHGKINTELDEVDLEKMIIYEDKNASGLDGIDLDYPQTEEQWARKQIFKKGKNRIEALLQEKFTLSGVDPVELPDITQLKNIRNYIFRIDMDTPQLRDAVQKQLDELARLYPDYKFNATYGGK